jgi:hypothetical protein
MSFFYLKFSGHHAVALQQVRQNVKKNNAHSGSAGQPVKFNRSILATMTRGAGQNTASTANGDLPISFSPLQNAGGCCSRLISILGQMRLGQNLL